MKMHKCNRNSGRLNGMNQKSKWRKLCSLLLAAAMLAGCGNTEEKIVSEVSEAEETNTAESSKDTEISIGMPKQMPAFIAKDLQGNEITESIFAEKDLTVVNIWGTFCPPCIAEMPELGEWAKEMPDNVQLVGLIVDIQGDNDTEHHDLAVMITEKAGAEFTQIIANEDLSDITRWVVGVPTTLFVDKEGTIVGEAIVGADVDGYKSFVEDYIDGK